MNIKAIKHIFKPPFFLWPIKAVLFIGGLFIFLLLKALRPLIDIRLGCLRYDRIGHLAANTELYLRRRSHNGRRPRVYHLFFSGKPANQQLLKMIRRRIPVINNSAALWTYEAVRLFMDDSDLWLNFPRLYKHFYEFNNIPPQLCFSLKEEARGRELLKSMGIEPGQPFVCLHVRDSAYLDKVNSPSKEYWSYHDYRDADLNNYLPAARYLASLGIFVIRMGHTVERELKDSDPHIIDYANRYRCDFGDIYLTAKCKFFIGGEGGLTTVPWIFNVPVAYANSAPVGAGVGWRKSDVFISKKLWSVKLERFLAFSEVFSLGAHRWLESKDYKEAGTRIVENSPQEIVDLVKEMNSRLDGEWVAGSDDEELQQRYRDIIPKNHMRYGFPSRISAGFLRNNLGLLKEVGQLNEIRK